MTIKLFLTITLSFMAPVFAMELSKKQTPLVKDLAKQRQYTDTDIVKVLPQGADAAIPLTVGLANLSRTLKSLIEDAGIDSPLPLPSVPESIWLLIAPKLETVHAIENRANNASTLQEDLIEYIKKLDAHTYAEMLAAVNYLDISLLFKLMIEQYDLQKLPIDELTQLSADVQRMLLMRFILEKLGPVPVLQTAILEHPEELVSFCVSGNRIISNSGDQMATMRLWDLATGKQIEQWRGDFAFCTAVDGDNFALGCWNGSIHIWNLSSGEHIGICNGHKNSVFSVSVIGNKIVSGSRDNTIRVWDLASSKQIVQCDGHTAPVSCTCVVDDKIISGSWDRTVRVWDLSSGNQIAEFKGHTDDVNSVCLEGDKIISASADRTVRIWDLVTGKQIARIKHTSAVISVCVVVDKIISCAADGSLSIWDIATGKHIAECNGHTHMVRSVCVAGDKIVSGSHDKTIRIWDMSLLNRLRSAHKKNLKRLWVYLQNVQILPDDHPNAHMPAIILLCAKCWEEIEALLAENDQDTETA